MVSRNSFILFLSFLLATISIINGLQCSDYTKIAEKMFEDSSITRTRVVNGGALCDTDTYCVTEHYRNYTHQTEYHTCAEKYSYSEMSPFARGHCRNSLYDDSEIVMARENKTVRCCSNADCCNLPVEQAMYCRETVRLNTQLLSGHSDRVTVSRITVLLMVVLYFK